MENNFCVYCHISPSGKRYIGITSAKPEKRWDYGRGYRGPAFRNAIDKYGWESFEHIILATNLSQADAFQMERKLIAEYQTRKPEFGYNITPGGDGHELSERGRKNVSEGLKKYYEDPDAHRKISEARKKYYREHPEAIEKLREQHTGLKASDEARAKMSASQKGKTYSEETRRKISESKKGWNPSPETRARMSEARRHVPLTQEKVDTLRENAEKRRQAVIATNKETGERRWFPSVTDASMATQVKHPHISRCLHGGRPSAGGYYWEYANKCGDSEEWQNQTTDTVMDTM